MAKALDTFRTPPYLHNCAQAVANRWSMLYGERNIVEEYVPYVGGRAPQGYCGALFAAIEACPDQASDILKEFVDICGAAHCRDIKGAHRTSCQLCVDTADKLVEKYQSSARATDA